MFLKFDTKEEISCSGSFYEVVRNGPESFQAGVPIFNLNFTGILLFFKAFLHCFTDALKVELQIS